MSLYSGKGYTQGNPWTQGEIRRPYAPAKSKNPQEISFKTRRGENITIRWESHPELGGDDGYYCYVNGKIRGWVISCIDHAALYPGYWSSAAYDAVTIAMHPYCERMHAILVKRVRTLATPRSDDTQAYTLDRPIRWWS